MRIIVDEEKRTVVAIIETEYITDWCEWHSIEDEAFEHMYKTLGDDIAVLMIPEFIKNLPNKFIGKAKCSPNDDFDAETGIELAKTRAKQKCCNAMARSMEQVYLNLINKLAFFRETIDKTYAKRCEAQNQEYELIEYVS